LLAYLQFAGKPNRLASTAVLKRNIEFYLTWLKDCRMILVNHLAAVDITQLHDLIAGDVLEVLTRTEYLLKSSKRCHRSLGLTTHSCWRCTHALRLSSAGLPSPEALLQGPDPPGG
jgi:hypothetical protein